MNINLTRKLLTFSVVAILAACSLSPGMHMKTTKKFGSDTEVVYIDSLKKELELVNINRVLTDSKPVAEPYKIGVGDEISITVWGLPDIFPIVGVNYDQNLRRVDSNGNIYFPYVGIIKAKGKTETELRENLSSDLSSFFTEPQLDVTIANFNSQKVYLLGEVTKPDILNLTDIPISLADALGFVKGLNTNTAEGGDVFIIRQSETNPIIYRADLSSPASFIDAGKFYLENDDIVFVNSKGTARWNKVISQFFPFSTFLNSIDNLTND